MSQLREAQRDAGKQGINDDIDLLSNDDVDSKIMRLIIIRAVFYI